MLRKLYSKIKSARNSKRANINNMIILFIYYNVININSTIIIILIYII